MAISKIWEMGGNIAVLRVGQELNHYEALSKEFAVIKAVGLGNLTNQINGTCYGDMENNWREHEILNFGNLLLYNCLENILFETPTLIHFSDIVLKTKH